MLKNNNRFLAVCVVARGRGFILSTDVVGKHQIMPLSVSLDPVAVTNNYSYATTTQK